MSLQFLEAEFNKLLVMNKKYGKWEKGFVDRLNKGKVVSIRLYETFKKTPIDWDTLWTITSIGTFTLTNNVNNFEYVLNEAIKRGIIKNFEKLKLGYRLTAKDNEAIRFIKLTDFIPTLDDDVKKRLHSKERAGHCHWDSVHLSLNIEYPNKVVSGYCTIASKKMPFPHTWVEIEYKGQSWVLDFTRNMVMNKEGYYKLFEPKNIVSIDSETLENDMKLRSITSFEDKDIRMYIFNPNEAREVMQEEFKSRKTYETGEFPYILEEK